MGCGNTKTNNCNNNNINVKNQKNHKDIVNYFLFDNSNANKFLNVNIAKNNFIKFNKDNISNHYKLIKSLGSGSFGEVSKVLHLKSNNYYAVKKIPKDTMSYSIKEDDFRKDFLNEIDILSQMDHPNIIKIYEYFEDNYNFYIVQELIEGGDLYEHLLEIYEMPESLISKIYLQLLSALVHVHSINIIHRDIKPMNILVRFKETDNNKKLYLNNDDFDIVVIDFGVSKKTKYIMNDEIGTPIFMAPEILKKTGYNNKVDIYSSGIMLWMLFTGKTPYTSCNNYYSLINSILKDELPIPDNISDNAKTFLKSMLEKNPINRSSASQLIKFKFIIEHDTNNYKVDKQLLNLRLKGLKEFSLKNKLSQACRAYIAHIKDVKSLGKNNDDIKKVFKELDTTGDNRISKLELLEGFNKCKIFNSQNELNLVKIFNECDLNNNGYVDYEEFVASAMKNEEIICIDTLKLAFNYFDQDKNNKLSFKEIKNILIMFSNYDNKLIEEIFINDNNKDGEIDFNEFMKCF